MSVRIGVDARKAADYGIGTHVRNLVERLVGLERGVEWVLFHRPGDEALLPQGDRVRLVPERAGGYSLRELTALAAKARELQLDLYHAPHYVLPARLPCPAVVTVHDLIHLQAREYRGLPRLYARLMIGRAVAAAARVITVSHASARDIAAAFPRARGKLAVIPNGVEEIFRPRPAGEAEAHVAEAFGIAAPYVLFVGNPKGHKNLDLLLSGFVRLARRYPGLLLVAVGGDAPQRHGLEKRARRLGIQGRARFVAPVDREALALLYAGAALFAFPSLHEGFGLPPLEAMACGTPVAASSAASLPEVLGPAAAYFSPQDEDSLVEAVCRVLDDAALRERLVRLGLERARLFSWDEAARRTLGVYREALG
ncbi:MAG TPA: glycosyltransferase family 1 protein [bacterium]